MTLLLLHGTGGNENSLLGLGAELMPAANLLSPRGAVLENNMPRFFRRIAEGLFDIEDLHVRTADLAAFVREASVRYDLASAAIVALGYSNGANIGASLLLSEPNLLAGAVLLRAMAPFEPDVPLSLPETPVLLLSGDRDPLIPLHNANRLAEILRGSGADVRQKVVHAGHALTEPELELTREFLAGIRW